jgi:hypothetical protein
MERRARPAIRHSGLEIADHWRFDRERLARGRLELDDARATEERLRLACSAAYRRLKGACKCPGQSHAALALMSKADPKSPNNDLDVPTSSSGRSEVDLDQPLLERA